VIHWSFRAPESVRMHSGPLARQQLRQHAKGRRPGVCRGYLRWAYRGVLLAPSALRIPHKSARTPRA